MRVRVGCEFRFEAAFPTPTVWQVRPREDGPHRVVSASWETTPPVTTRSYRDLYGNVCDRLTLPDGTTTVRYDAVVEVPAEFDPADKAAAEVPVESLPDDALLYLLPSRLCPSDALHDTAWELFGGIEPGWSRVQAVADRVHGHVRFQMGSSTPVTTAADVYESRTGVCRDFAHLGVTFCRALNIPARYVCGYLPDIAVPPPDEPMDFCAWLEVFLDGTWWTLDPRNNVPRTGRVVIGRGRDAVDVAMVTSYGNPVLQHLAVWADEVPDGSGEGPRPDPGSDHDRGVHVEGEGLARP